MSRASLKDQLQAVAPKISETFVATEEKPSPISNKINSPGRHSSNTVQTNRANHSSKPQWLEAAYYGIELLKAYFPDCFKSGQAIRPLKKGIKQDLVKRLSTIEGIVLTDKACMIKSLSHYVSTVHYQKQITEGKERIDLDGQACGSVTPEEVGKILKQGKSPQTLEAMAWYLGLLIGTVQLCFMPDGGIWITGGVVLNHSELLKQEAFYLGIQASPAYIKQREQFPLGILLGEDHAFLGGAYYATKRLLR